MTLMRYEALLAAQPIGTFYITDNKDKRPNEETICVKLGYDQWHEYFDGVYNVYSNYEIAEEIMGGNVAWVLA